MSGTYYDLSALVTQNVSDISDVSGLVFDLSKNFHDLSSTYYTLSGDYDAFKNNVKSPDASFDTIGGFNNNEVMFSSDVSFNGNINAGDASFGVIRVTHIKGYSPIEIMDDVSINTRLTVPDGSFSRIEPIDGSLIIMGDISVNGQIFSSGGLVGGGGGSGKDASFNVIQDFLDGSGVTFVSDVSINTRLTVPDASFSRIGGINGNLVITSDISVSGNILADNMEFIPTGALQNYKLFENVPASSDVTDTSWSVFSERTFKSGSVAIHNIKVSGYIHNSLSSPLLNWPDSLHQYTLQRKLESTATKLWDSTNTYKTFDYIFNAQNVHEETTHTFMEKFTSEQSYTDWYLDVSGDVSNNTSDTLTWDVTVITPEVLSTASSINNVTLFDLSAGTDISTNTIWERANQSVSIPAGSMVFHDIKVTAYINPGTVSWPLEGHEFIFQRKTSSDVSYGWSSDLSYQCVKHIFNAQDVHEEQTYAMIETIPNKVDYTYWKCDVSGDKARTNNLDKLTWKMIVITPSDYYHPTLTLTDLSQNFHDLSGTYYDLSTVVTQNISDINDVSGLVFDLSQNFHDLSGTYYTLSAEYDAYKENVKTNDLSVNNISHKTGNNVRFLSDVSFNNDVTITGDLIIDGSFNFNDVIHNITTVNNELVISTQLDICNQGTGPALEVTQIGSGSGNDVALFKYGTSDSSKAFEINYDGNAIFYKDVSFNNDISTANIITTGRIGINNSNPQESLDVIGNIKVSGNITAVSDARFKKNKILITNATETLQKLTPQIYDKFSTMDFKGTSSIESGLITQEVYYNVPELRHLVHLGKEIDACGNEYTPQPRELDISTIHILNSNEYKNYGWSNTNVSALNYSGLIPYLIRCVQELKVEIELLKKLQTK